jgi:glycosyltransferase involved in cell wall biosynthesis
MRICFLCQEDIVKPQGGTGTYVRNVSRSLAARGHDVSVIARRCDEAPAYEEVDQVKVHRVDAPGPPVLYSPLYFMESRRKFLELHRLLPFDVVQGNMPLMSSWGLRGGDLPPFVETVHCTVQEELRAVSDKSVRQLNLNEMLSQVLSPVWQSRERHLLERAQQVIAVSQGLKRELIAQHGYSANNVAVIPNGVDSAHFADDPTLLAKAWDLRLRLGIHADDPVILYLGRLMERKRVIDLVNALPMILMWVPNARLVIVGKRNSNAERLEEAARSLLVEDRVKFVDHVPYGEVPAYYTMADVFCLPSAYEGFPFTVLEAMAAGIPVVASDIPGINEQITPNETGLLHTVGDLKQITQNVARVLGDRDFARRLSAAGKALVREKYDWSVIGARTEETFRRAIAGAAWAAERRAA